MIMEKFIKASDVACQMVKQAMKDELVGSEEFDVIILVVDHADPLLMAIPDPVGTTPEHIEALKGFLESFQRQLMMKYEAELADKKEQPH